VSVERSKAIEAVIRLDVQMTGSGATSAELETLYRERFRAFLLSVTALLRDGEAALDVVQEGFSLALQRRTSFRGDGSVEAWVWRIVLNVARDRQRSSRKQRRLLPAAASEERQEPYADLREALLALPERQRLAVFLRYYADLSYTEIAAALDVRPGTVAASLNAAHTALRRDLKEVAR
jgi:RNA polymerase sigma factor (sigma-70 family)